MSYKVPELFAAISADSPYLNFCHSGFEQCAPGYSYGPAMRDFYLIHYVLSGKGQYFIGGETYHVNPGQAFLIPPNTMTLYTADSEDPWKYCFFAFSGKMAKELLRRTGFADSYVVTLNDDTILDMIRETSDTILSGKVMNTDIYALTRLTQILKLFMDVKGETQRREHNMNNYVLLALNYIEYNYFKPITVESISDMIAINRSHFYRIFKAEMGMSPTEYLNNFRIDKAKRLLAESTMPVSQVAASTGFVTPSAFFRMFRLRFGMSPSKYRKQCLASDLDTPGFS